VAIFTKKRVIWGLGAVLVLGLVGGGIVARASKKSPVSDTKNAPVTLEFSSADLTRVEAQPLRPRLRVSGSLQPVHQTVVKAKVPGEIKSLAAREGEGVGSGKVLAQLDTSDSEARLAEKIGNLDAARAQLALAEKTRTSNLALLKQGFISQNAYDSAATTFDANRGTLQVWEAQVQLARNALRDATVVAPLGGTVAKRHVQPGERVSIDTPLFTIVDLRALELQAPVPAVDVPLLQAGMAVSLQVDGFGAEPFAGRISRINPSTEPGTRSILVYVSLANPGGKLRAGMFASGEVLLAATQPVPTLPATALRKEGGETFAWLLEDGKLARRAVSVGQRDETQGRVEVLKGIPADAWVLAGKFDLIKEGQAAKLKPDAPGAKAQ
jgi:RND family efflux transporter MFP subunit